MTQDTQFPYAEDGWSGDAEALSPEEVDAWFVRCIEDFPTMYSGIARINGEAVNATLELPPVVTAWFNKWFSQFVEGR